MAAGLGRLAESLIVTAGHEFHCLVTTNHRKEKRKFKRELVFPTEAKLTFGQLSVGYVVKNGKVCSGDKPTRVRLCIWA